MAKDETVLPATADSAPKVASKSDPMPAADRKGTVTAFLSRPLSVGNGLLILVIAGAIVVLLALAIGPTLTGSLTGINNTEYARGLITLVFSGGTMLIAILLTLFVITSESTEADKRFTQGKEVLTLLIGVFGTILGFYFGKAEASQEGPSPAVEIRTPEAAPQPQKAGDATPVAPDAGSDKK
ncbi:MAG: hypothetical protein JNM43_11255 [Planctomycetaceae bacterium]|nr:hypothetical protein [Planctomycetaceae bacterium]